jgi:hypothetical protein
MTGEMCAMSSSGTTSLALGTQGIDSVRYGVIQAAMAATKVHRLAGVQALDQLGNPSVQVLCPPDAS